MLTALGNTKLAELLLKVFASDSPLRRRLMDPAQILQGAQVRAGQTVLEVGCGRGFFTIPAGRDSGPARPAVCPRRRRSGGRVRGAQGAGGRVGERHDDKSRWGGDRFAGGRDGFGLAAWRHSCADLALAATLAGDAACVETGRRLGRVDGRPRLVARLDHPERVIYLPWEGEWRI
jgi:hypothetical protein